MCKVSWHSKTNTLTKQWPSKDMDTELYTNYIQYTKQHIPQSKFQSRYKLIVSTPIRPLNYFMVLTKV